MFDIASMFVGVGEVSAALKGTKLATSLSKGMNAFKAAAKASSAGKLGKAAKLLDKTMKYGDKAAKTFVEKLKKLPFPIAREVAIPGGGTVKAIGKGTLEDFMKIVKSDFSKVKSGTGSIGKKASETLDHIPKMPEIEVKFKRNANHDPEEFIRQLKKQQDGMNQLTIEEYLKNRQQYLDKGRVPEASVAQQTARQEALADKISELRNQGMSRAEAKSQAEEWMKKQAALHDPDMIAGGNPTNIQGLGDSNINSSIGSQWRTRISEVDRQIQEIAKNMTPEQLKEIRINIKLTE